MPEKFPRNTACGHNTFINYMKQTTVFNTPAKK